MRLLWATDVHLDHARGNLRDFAAQVRAMTPDLLLVTGDISVAPLLEGHLNFLAELAPRFAFVLGNHDFWGGGIMHTRKKLLAARLDQYLQFRVPMRIGERSVLIGVDGWYDCRAGTPSGLLMNDWWNIAEFKYRGSVHVHTIARDLADDDTRLLETRLLAAAAMPGVRCVYIATHVPPFRETSLYGGKPGPENSVGYFTNVGMGDMLLQVAAEHPEIRFVVLGGHSHDECARNMAPNLAVHVGAAEYGSPWISSVFEVV